MCYETKYIDIIYRILCFQKCGTIRVEKNTSMSEFTNTVTIHIHKTFFFSDL